MRSLAALLVLLAPLGVSCGGGEDKESVENLFDQAFQQKINSANLKVEAELD